MRITDQTGYSVALPSMPSRIVSLVPSQTEYLYALGLDNEVVGVTWFCIHPKEQTASAEKVGGTKKLDLAKIAELQPDLVIANKEENYKEDVLALRQDFQVYTSDIQHPADAYQMMLDIGKLCDKEPESQAIVRSCQKALEPCKKLFNQVNGLYLIWQKPWMGVGNDTFIHSMMRYLGIQNTLSLYDRYPELDQSLLDELQPEWVMYSSEPFPFQEKHMTPLKKRWPNAKHTVVDGEFFSWYGNRMAKAGLYFQQLYRELYGH